MKKRMAEYMKTQPKIKIVDSSELRQQLDSLYHRASQITIAVWSLKIAEHILDKVEFAYKDNDIILTGFLVNKKWQKGNARIHDVRQAGFKVHSLAKSIENERIRTAIRVAGQAVGTGHMKEHGMVASDYAIKVINLMQPNDISAVIAERKWQIDALQDELLLY